MSKEIVLYRVRFCCIERDGVSTYIRKCVLRIGIYMKSLYTYVRTYVCQCVGLSTVRAEIVLY